MGTGQRPQELSDPVVPTCLFLLSLWTHFSLSEFFFFHLSLVLKIIHVHPFFPLFILSLAPFLLLLSSDSSTQPLTPFSIVSLLPLGHVGRKK